jgi:acyl dehydratase
MMPASTKQESSLRVRRYRIPVEATQILMFERAVGNDNPIYRDTDHAAKTEPSAWLPFPSS